MPALPIRKIIRLRYNLDITGFIRAAIRYNLNKEQVLIYLEIITTSTHDAIEKMSHFVSIAKQEDLTRNEILAWLHLSYGGRLDPEHLSQNLASRPDVLRMRSLVWRRRRLLKTATCFDECLKRDLQDSRIFRIGRRED